MIGMALAGASLGVGIAGLGAGRGMKHRLPRLSKEGKEAQGTLYDIIQRGISGGGLYPYGYGTIADAYTESFRESMGDYESQINRAIPKADVKVRSYLGKILPRAHQSLLLSLKESEKQRPFEEQDMATKMGWEALASEKRTATDFASMANENALRLANMPTFASQLGYGLGGAGGWMWAAQNQPAYLRYAQGMAGGLS